ncbi:LysR family transcriptional regulator [Virgibacillus sp. 179-BFC.A HS]|uniref:LysR family transcriptional regulator n=1 Tax=Tigheibacillus jepli TaxID=3035914 RepID=A0ABU5CDC2_9BACI|nr:LysR family transcriptional regulator [Virgibacillus sp. 179-BFC.A HS]MDY0404304.1 LysR family transcriptional regulator [Virgibacillus sp. 179-BFC.A HS]
MEWQQLTYFREVAKQQHMTKAAKSLSLTQPALSRSISRLEKELGVPLFERKGRSIVLNRYGELLLKRVNRMMAELEEAKQEISDIIDPENGEISLGFLHTLGTEKIPELIGAFRKTYPNLRFQFTQNNSFALQKQLEAGKFDLCLTTPIEAGLKINWARLWREELYVIVPIDHRLAKRKRIRLDEIATEHFIAIKEGNSLRQMTSDFFEEAGIAPTILFEGEEIHTLAGLVGAGLGVALIPEVKGLDFSKIVPLHVTWPTCERSLGLAWMQGRYLSPAAERFKAFVMAYFQKQDGE